MLEKLFAYALLSKQGFIPITEYVKYLGDCFLQHQSNALLLDLEYCSGDIHKAVELINLHVLNTPSFSYDDFGKYLFGELGSVYNSDNGEIHSFAKKIYELWKALPHEVQDKEPFWSLSYADDPLSWGDEEQTRELYQAAFDFYNHVD